MFRFYISFFLIIFSFITCGETYIKYDKKANVEPGTIRAKSPTLLLSYSINKEYVLIIKDSDNVKTYYKLSVEDTAPFMEAFKTPIGKNLGLLVQDESVLQKSKTISKLEPIEEENLTKLWNGPLLLKIKQANLIPDILSETNSEQLILAREDFHFEKKRHHPINQN
ncbi:MAG: hypothetical protein IPO06_24135 [Leptospiraceae bacterium]|nr:hypothetical protein [Leptospiraceae bacterium]